MTAPTPFNYNAPDGFYKSYSYDKNGQVFADGKELNGVRMDGIKEAGKIAGLSADAQGNVFANIETPRVPTPPVLGFAGGGNQSVASSIVNGKYETPANPFINMNQPIISKIKLSGVQLDPDRYSKGGNGELGTNQLYLRPDDSGAYFAQVNQNNNVVAYAYSAIQQMKNPDVGGPQTPTSNTQRRQGGNAGGGVSAESSMVSLLGD